MELFNQSESARLQQRIALGAQLQVEAVLPRAAEFPDLPEQLYLLGTTVLPLLRAGHHLVLERLGTAKADDWLWEHFRALGTMLSEGAKRSLTITVISTPRP